MRSNSSFTGVRVPLCGNLTSSFRRVMVVFGLLVVHQCSGCGGGVETTPGCTPGATQWCGCSDGGAGLQTCTDENLFGECVCTGNDVSDVGYSDTADIRLFDTSAGDSATLDQGLDTSDSFEESGGENEDISAEDLRSDVLVGLCDNATDRSLLEHDSFQTMVRTAVDICVATTCAPCASSGPEFCNCPDDLSLGECNITYCVLRCIEEYAGAENSIYYVRESALSADCLSCHAETASCGVSVGCSASPANCSTNSSTCQCRDCLCESGCLTEFAACSGLSTNIVCATEDESCVLDCSGTFNGPATTDMCGSCDDNPDNDCVQDCAEVWGGPATTDMCGTCDDDPTNDCVQDCEDVWGGSATTDMCGTCDTNPDNDCVQDCAGAWGGSATTDMCLVCDDDPTNNCVQDCLGSWGGSATTDMCGSCDDNPANDCVQDCDDVWGGSASTDMCGTCDTNPDNDCVQDCSGAWGGSATTDLCGTCDDNPANDCIILVDLTITLTGTSVGGVSNSSLGINCGRINGSICTDCTASVLSHTEVTLQGHPVGGSSVTDWGHSDCTAGPECTFTITEATALEVSIDMTANLVFITSHTLTADGIDAADASCNDAADTVGLPGTYIAWLSTNGADSVDAVDRLRNARDPDPEPRGWMRYDGRSFVDSIDDLISGQIFHPVLFNEVGVQQNINIATGTGSGGTAGSSNCENWTNRFVGTDRGVSTGTAGAWTYLGGTSCGSTINIYCFGTDLSVEVAPEPETGPIAFLSTPYYVNAGGVDDADEHCAEDAQGHLPGNYAALLATEELTALERHFNLESGESIPWPDQAWVRPDGVQIVEDPEDFATGPYLAPINVTAQQSYAGRTGVWTGSLGGFAVLPSDDSETCSDWTSTGSTGVAGSTTNISDVFGDDTTGCGSGFRLYCLQTD